MSEIAELSAEVKELRGEVKELKGMLSNIRSPKNAWVVTKNHYGYQAPSQQ